MRTRIKVLFLVIVAILVIAGLVVAFSILKPTPPRSITMSTGPEGSAYALFAEQYRDYFAKNNIEIMLQRSAGAPENLARLMNPDGDVDVAFITMGANNPTDSHVKSLGAMFYEPMWVFFSHADIAGGDLRAVQGKRVSIGPQGSRSNIAARQLFGLVGLNIDNVELLEIDPLDAAEQLKAGTIDASIMVTSASTPVVRELLADENVGLANFKRAAAYEALYPALTGLTVPAGVGDLASVIPPHDVNILSFTAIMAVREDLHPAIQTLLLDAAMGIHAVPDLFHADGSFPSQRVYKVPLSSSAQRYYTSGPPFLTQFLPFWLAVLVRQLLVMSLPLVGVLYPAIRVMPSIFGWAMRRRIFKLYGELKDLESKVRLSGSDEEKEKLLKSLDNLDRKVRRLRMPVSFAHLVYTLRTHISVVRAGITQD
jgi:TRAP-type uncharacterized transport system substrate-binding protein